MAKIHAQRERQDAHRSMPIRTCRCSMRCATTSASTIRNSAAGSRNAAPAPCIMDGQAIRSCITPVSSVGAAKVVTLAGLGTPEKPHPLQTAYVEEQVPQCGYCINGWIMTAAAFLATKKKPTDAEIKERARRRQVPLRHACQHLARRSSAPPR